MDLVELAGVDLTYTTLESLDYGSGGQLYGTMEGLLTGGRIRGPLRLTNLAAGRTDNVNLPTLRDCSPLTTRRRYGWELDGLATLRPEDNARVFVTSFRLRTGDQRYAWLNTVFGLLERVLDRVAVGGRAHGQLFECRATEPGDDMCRPPSAIPAPRLTGSIRATRRRGHDRPAHDRCVEERLARGRFALRPGRSLCSGWGRASSAAEGPRYRPNPDPKARRSDRGRHHLRGAGEPRRRVQAPDGRGVPTGRPVRRGDRGEPRIRPCLRRGSRPSSLGCAGGYPGRVIGGSERDAAHASPLVDGIEHGAHATVNEVDGEHVDRAVDDLSPPGVGRSYTGRTGRAMLVR